MKIFSGKKNIPKYLKFSVLIRKPDCTKNIAITKVHKTSLNKGERLNLSSSIDIKNIEIKK